MIDRTSGLAPSNCAGAQQLRGAGLLGQTTLVDLAMNVKPGARWLALRSPAGAREPGWLGSKGVGGPCGGRPAGPQTPALAPSSVSGRRPSAGREHLSPLGGGVGTFERSARAPPPARRGRRHVERSAV